MTEGASLLELQEVDLQLKRSTKQLDEMPEKKAIITARHKLKDVEALRAKAAEFVRRVEQEVSRLEDEGATLTTKITSEQKRVMSGDITNAKELQHITREVDSLKRRREKTEMELLAAMERVEKAKSQETKVQSAIEKLQASEGRLVDEFKDKGGGLQTQIDQLTRVRERLCAQLPSELLEKYESLRSAKGGVGAGRLDVATCTACRIELPAQRVSELSAQGGITECPACRRLLVIVDEEGSSGE